MGRITTSVTIENVAEPAKTFRFDALVDTGCSYLALPSAWKDRLGEMKTLATIDLETSTPEIVQGEICGPVKIQLEGFCPIYNEVLFVEMQPEDGICQLPATKPPRAAAIVGACE